MILLEKYVLDELDQQQRARVESAILLDPDLKEKLNEIKVENSMFEQKHPFPAKYLDTQNPRRTYKTNSSAILGYSFAGLIVFVVAFALLPHTEKVEHTYKSDEIEMTRVKGIMPSLRIYRKTEDGFEIIKNNSKVVAHDVLQLAYIPGSAKYGLIFSLDGNAQVTLHYPYSKSDSTQLNNNGETRLSFSYELDDAPGFERFFFLASDKPLDLQKIIQAAHVLPEDKHMFENLVSENEIIQTTITLMKDE